MCEVQKIHFEPRLLSPADDRLTQRQQSGQSVQSLQISTTTIRNNTTDRNVFCVFMFIGSDDYLYRMKALDAVRDTGNISSFCTCKRNNPISNQHISVDFFRFSFPWTGWHSHRCDGKNISDLAAAAAKFPLHA